MLIPEAEQNNLEAFLTHFHQKSYPKNAIIVSPGDPADTLYYVVDGSLVVTLEDEEGQELILSYLNPGEFLGEMGLFVEQSTRNVQIRTRTPCKLAAIGYDRVRQLVQNEEPRSYIPLLFAIGVQLSNRLLRTSRQAGLLAFQDVTGRIARMLLDLCEQPDAMTHPDGMQIRVTRQELSRLVGCSREMAGRILKTMEEQGTISVEGKKTIIVHGAR